MIRSPSPRAPYIRVDVIVVLEGVFLYMLGDKSPSGREETWCVYVCVHQQQYILLQGVFFIRFNSTKRVFGERIGIKKNIYIQVHAPVHLDESNTRWKISLRSSDTSSSYELYYYHYQLAWARPPRPHTYTQHTKTNTKHKVHTPSHEWRVFIPSDTSVCSRINDSQHCVYEWSCKCVRLLRLCNCATHNVRIMCVGALKSGSLGIVYYYY